jgi:ferredoxin/flavodoxin---NADP+ reductase
MFNATIIKRIDVTSSRVIFYVKPDGGIPDFLPGQYVVLGMPLVAGAPAGAAGNNPASDLPLIKRLYSVGSPPHQKNYYEFLIAIMPDGGLSSRLAVMREGERIYCGTKVAGSFTLKGLPTQAGLVLIATGTGIACFMSMLRTPATWSAGRKIVLLHGVPYAADFVYRQELLELAAARPEFSYFGAVSRGDPDWSGRRGYVQEYLKGGVVTPDPGSDHVFLCGNPAMVTGTCELLVQRGFSVHSGRNAGNLHVEKYW